MSRVGRPPRKIPTEHVHLYIRYDLLAKVDLLLLDPMRERVRYGARSRLVESLLERWINEQIATGLSN